MRLIYLFFFSTILLTNLTTDKCVIAKLQYLGIHLAMFECFIIFFTNINIFTIKKKNPSI